jgi:hypothetical protein
MKGYVKNISREWAYAMKRSVRPGGEIPLTELFEQYGKKYDMKPGDSFIEWLQTIKLKNTDMWKVVYDFKDTPPTEKKSVKSEDVVVQTVSHTAPMVATKMQVEDVVNLTVRKAREVLPNVTDLGLLKYSLSEARQMAGKDSLCRLLYKRVGELQISR